MKITRKNYCSPLLSFDIYLDYYHKTIKQFKSQSDIDELHKSIETRLSPKLESTIKEEVYDAIVVTDTTQTIVWVSDGFHDMTGYSSRFAIGKQPNFLQGKGTQELTKKSIRLNLNNDSSYSGSIINYKKNGEEYLCQLKLFPLKNTKNEITHYLALERRLEAA